MSRQKGDIMAKNEFKIGDIRILRNETDYRIVKGEIIQDVSADLMNGIARFVLLEFIEAKDKEITALQNAQYAFSEVERVRRHTEKEKEIIAEKCVELQEKYDSFVADYRRVTNALLDQLGTADDDCDYDD